MKTLETLLHKKVNKDDHKLHAIFSFSDHGAAWISRMSLFSFKQRMGFFFDNEFHEFYELPAARYAGAERVQKRPRITRISRMPLFSLKQRMGFFFDNELCEFYELPAARYAGAERVQKRSATPAKPSQNSSNSHNSLLKKASSLPEKSQSESARSVVL